MTRTNHPHPRATLATEHLDAREIERIRAVAFPTEAPRDLDELRTTAMEPLAHRRPAMALDPRSLSWSPAMTPAGAAPLRPEAFARGTNVEWAQLLQDEDDAESAADAPMSWATPPRPSRDLRGFAIGLAAGIAVAAVWLVACAV